MRCFWRRVNVGVVAAIGLCLSVAAYGNVYPSGVSVDASGLNTEPCGTAKVTYILNENASGDGLNPGVKIEVLDNTSTAVRTVTIARQSKGAHVFEWDGRKDDGSRAPNGSYTVRITATDFGYTTWTQTSSDALTQSKYYSPRGVSVNRNAASPNFGRIYVAEALGGPVAAGGRTTTDGMYVMAADQSDVLGQGDIAYAGGVDWTTGGTSSPWKVSVAPDDSVYIADWSDGHSGIWRCNADPQALFDEILTNAGRQASGLVPGVHGSVAAVWVEGTGAGTKLYTVDEDYPLAGGAYVAGMGDVLRYDIGTATGYGSAPVQQTIDGTNASGAPYDPGVILNSLMDFVRDEDGSWWICQYRYTDSNSAPSLTRFLDGATGWVYNSGVAGLNLTVAYGSIDIHDGLDLLAMGRRDGAGVAILDISDPANPTIVANVPQSGYTRDVAFDEAGNLYVVSSSSETLRIWSPPSGANSYATVANSTIVLNKGGSGGPSISSQPTDVVACAGDTVQFSVVASGTGLTYQWTKNGVDVPGATTATLTLTNVQAVDGGATIAVQVCDNNGVVVSKPAILNVGVSFLQAPLTQTVCVNSDATFTVNVSGKGAISYAWEKDTAGDNVFAPVSGATTATLVLSSVQETDSGTQVRCKVTDACGTVTSPTAVMTVWTGPEITNVFYDINVLPGGSASCGTYASGRGTLTYQWVKDGVPLANGGTEPVVSGATEDTMSLQNIPVSWNGSVISVWVTDECGQTKSELKPGGPTGTVSVIVAFATENVAPDGCTNGADDDHDGYVDCEDPDCAFSASCGLCSDPFADADGDGDVDQADFSVVQLCMTGSGTFTIPSACSCFNRDGDQDIDADDLAEFEACASGPGLPADPNCDAVSATVVINELVYHEYDGSETREFVELYNYGDNPVNITGWVLRCSDTAGPPTDDNPDYAVGIKPPPGGYNTVELPAGAYYVLGTSEVPNYNQSLGTVNLFENDNEAIQLLDASGNVIDTVIYERNKGPVAVSGEGAIWMNFDSVDASLQSLARWTDGYDTNNNGRDFGVRRETPGLDNLAGDPMSPIGSLVTAYVVPDVDALLVGSDVSGLTGSFVNARVIDPAVADGNNTAAISPSPQTGKAIIAWDPSGGGNMVASDDVCKDGASFDMYVYLDTQPYGVGQLGGESTTYGILGTTGPLYNFPNPDSNPAFGGDVVTANGNTGIGWVYQKETNTNNVNYLMSLSLCDFGAGGDSSDGPLTPRDWSIITTIDLSAQASGWHRLSVTYNPATGAVEAKFDAQTFNFTTATNLVGGFYVGYRESLLANNAPLTALRPPTFDSVP